MIHKHFLFSLILGSVFLAGCYEGHRKTSVATTRHAPKPEPKRPTKTNLILNAPPKLNSPQTQPSNKKVEIKEKKMVPFANPLSHFYRPAKRSQKGVRRHGGGRTVGSPAYAGSAPAGEPSMGAGVDLYEQGPAGISAP